MVPTRYPTLFLTANCNQLKWINLFFVLFLKILFIYLFIYSFTYLLFISEREKEREREREGASVRGNTSRGSGIGRAGSQWSREPDAGLHPRTLAGS